MFILVVASYLGAHFTPPYGALPCSWLGQPPVRRITVKIEDEYFGADSKAYCAADGGLRYANPPYAL